MKQRSIFVFDSTTGERTWYECVVVNHELKLLRRKEFMIDCGFCHTLQVTTLETHIQHGIFEDRFWEHVYCGECSKITIHRYTVGSNENNG